MEIDKTIQNLNSENFPSENTAQHSVHENISNNENKNDADRQLENNFNDQNINTKGAKNRQNEGSPGTEINDSKKIMINDENEKYENMVKLDNNNENPEENQESKKKKKKKVCLLNEYPSVPHRPPQFNTSVPHKDHTFSAPKIPSVFGVELRGVLN